MLGWTIPGAIATPSSTVFANNGTTLTVSQINLPIGTWLLVGTYAPYITITPSSISSSTINFSTGLNTVTYSIGYTTNNITQSTPGFITLSTTAVFTATSATTMYLNVTLQYNGGSLTLGTGANYFLYNATRIA